MVFGQMTCWRTNPYVAASKYHTIQLISYACLLMQQPHLIILCTKQSSGVCGCGVVSFRVTENRARQTCERPTLSLSSLPRPSFDRAWVSLGDLPTQIRATGKVHVISDETIRSAVGSGKWEVGSGR
ncbi:hypothetical protein GMDG_00719 [Pseudogymnoascus destructans 20631-21]|uniref:Uncharacterized protein n=1 Tax=Pseudogymnoascus destructans (strain ATCC MYA-4855 / 20631-21) TaxID=658429 RepID=L8GD02_PSED2|nr:hypothetical protein GMDG_00719 [Pseudogymnoascus destructans 20631-21]